MRKHNKGYIEIDIDLLKKLYVDERKTLSYLADNVFYVSKETILDRLQEHNITRNNPKGKKGNYKYISKEILELLYNDKKKSLHEIARHLNIHYATVLKRMIEYNIPRRHRAAHMKGKNI
jgi:DNA-binding Lrp family transcriptional regulator